MEIINEKNEVESVIVPEECLRTLEGIARLNAYPLRSKLETFESFADLSSKMAKVPLQDGTFTFVYSTHINFMKDSSHYMEFIFHLNENFEVCHYGVYFVQIND